MDKHKRLLDLNINKKNNNKYYLREFCCNGKVAILLTYLKS